MRFRLLISKSAALIGLALAAGCSDEPSDEYIEVNAENVLIMADDNMTMVDDNMVLELDADPFAKPEGVDINGIGE